MCGLPLRLIGSHSETLSFYVRSGGSGCYLCSPRLPSTQTLRVCQSPMDFDRNTLLGTSDSEDSSVEVRPMMAHHWRPLRPPYHAQSPLIMLGINLLFQFGTFKCTPSFNLANGTVHSNGHPRYAFRTRFHRFKLIPQFI